MFHLLLVYPTAEYEARRGARLDADVPGSYTMDQFAEEAGRVAQRVGNEYLGADAVGFEASVPSAARATASGMRSVTPNSAGSTSSRSPARFGSSSSGLSASLRYSPGRSLPLSPS